MTARTASNSVSRSVAQWCAATLDPNLEAAAQAVAELQWRAGSDPRTRARGAEILGGLGVPAHRFPVQSWAALVRHEQDRDVLVTCIHALGSCAIRAACRSCLSGTITRMRRCASPWPWHLATSPTASCGDRRPDHPDNRFGSTLPQSCGMGGGLLRRAKRWMTVMDPSGEPHLLGSYGTGRHHTRSG